MLQWSMHLRGINYYTSTCPCPFIKTYPQERMVVACTHTFLNNLFHDRIREISREIGQNSPLCAGQTVKNYSLSKKFSIFIAISPPAPWKISGYGTDWRICWNFCDAKVLEIVKTFLQVRTRRCFDELSNITCTRQANLCQWHGWLNPSN